MRSTCSLLVLIALVIGHAAAQRGRDERNIAPEIHGHVRLPTGRSVGAGLRVQLDGMGTGQHTETMTDSSGKFLFRGLSPDTYVLRVSGTGFQEHSETIQLQDVRLGFVTIELRPVKAERAQPPRGLISAEDASIPERARLEFNKGHELLEVKKNPKESLKHFRKAAEAYPQFARAYLMMGLANMEVNDWEAARKQLDKALQLNENLAQAQLALGSTLNAQTKFAEAEKPLRRGLQLAPDSTMGHYELARALWALGRVDEAKQEAEQALKLQPTFSEAHLLLGNVMLRQGNLDGATREYNEYLRLDPSGRFAEATRGMLKKIENAQVKVPK